MSTVAWISLAFVLGVLVGAALYWSVSRRGSTAGSIDHERLLQAVDEAAIVVDRTGVVEFANKAFVREFSPVTSGAAVATVFDAHPEIREHVETGTEAVVSVGSTHYALGTFPLDETRTLVLLYDVTAQKHREQRLEQQNEQLDQFATLVSHDLRNPLDVAIGRTNALQELNDDPALDEHIESTARALARMRRIVTDLLALARQGEEIGETRPTELAAVADDAWEHVDTHDATLSVETSASVVADRDALQHVFENLFRNAVEHAGPEVSVTVGTVEGGFFVADDGPGIPEADHERMFEAGETGDGSGTGLGLAIVANVTAAHGWELQLTAAEDGGTRFEFSQVELLSDATSERA